MVERQSRIIEGRKVPNVSAGNGVDHMAHKISAVLEYGAPEPGETATIMEDKLRFYTDSWDLSVDLKAGFSDIVVIDCSAAIWMGRRIASPGNVPETSSVASPSALPLPH
jgi:hypothetical protein